MKFMQEHTSKNVNLAQLGQRTKNCIKFHPVDPEMCAAFWEKDLRQVSPPHFVYDFSRKIFLISYCTDWQLLSDCLCFLKYWTMCVLQFFLSQFATPQILTWLILAFLGNYIAKTGQKLKYLKNGKSFYG